jgi:hypothetical protein
MMHMPELMAMHDAFADRGLVIIAVHDDSVASLEEMDSKLWDRPAKPPSLRSSPC